MSAFSPHRASNHRTPRLSAFATSVWSLLLAAINPFAGHMILSIILPPGLHGSGPGGVGHLPDMERPPARYRVHGCQSPGISV
jgi:hypothetical protein